MLNIAIIIILGVGFLVGFKRGFILQMIHLTSYFISFLVAYIYYEQLAPKLVLWIPYPHFGEDSTIKFFLEQSNLEDVYYRAIAFVAIFFAMKIVLHILGAMLDFVALLPVLKLANVWLGGILGLIEVYLLTFLILYFAALLPIEMIQTLLSESFMANGIVNNTPIFSQQIKDMWFK